MTVTTAAVRLWGAEPVEESRQWALRVRSVPLSWRAISGVVTVEMCEGRGVRHHDGHLLAAIEAVSNLS